MKCPSLITKIETLSVNEGKKFEKLDTNSRTIFTNLKNFFFPPKIEDSFFRCSSSNFFRQDDLHGHFDLKHDFLFHIFGPR